MATFPFDPTPFIPTNHQCIDVEGRLARVQVVAGAAALTHENCAIATIIPMPDLQVTFNTICEALADFLSGIKHMGFSEICPCPFGQAYVRLDSNFDRDELVLNSPHAFTDVHVIFQKHNEGLNWRKIVINREVWLLLCGFPFNRNCMDQVANAVRGFSKLLEWDKNKSTCRGKPRPPMGLEGPLLVRRVGGHRIAQRADERGAAR
uniref:DUF7597 domain-containing protein n=1 Tax=Aegilops tauschii TaxID=37682 RepID=M8ATA1_AEGTA